MASAPEGEDKSSASARAADFSPPLWLIAKRSQSARRRESAQRKLDASRPRMHVTFSLYIHRLYQRPSCSHICAPLQSALLSQRLNAPAPQLEGVIRRRAHHTLLLRAVHAIRAAYFAARFRRPGHRERQDTGTSPIAIYAGGSTYRHEFFPAGCWNRELNLPASRPLLQSPPRRELHYAVCCSQHQTLDETRSDTRTARLCGTSEDRSRQVAGEEVGTRRGPPLCRQ